MVFPSVLLIHQSLLYLVQFYSDIRFESIKECLSKHINVPLLYLVQFSSDIRFKFIKERLSKHIDDAIDHLSQIATAQNVFQVDKN